MKCRKMQKLILTDYVDGELREDLRKEVECHVRTCARCRELLQKVQGAVVEPLHRSERIQPPESLWNDIKDSIEHREAESPLETLRDRFRAILPPRKPVLAVITVSILFIVMGVLASTIFIRKNVLNIYLEDQMSFLDSLNNGNGQTYPDIGIPYEEFFL